MHKNIEMIFYRNTNFQRNFEQQFFFKYNQFITYKNTKIFFHRSRKFKSKHLKFSYLQFLEYKPQFLHFLYFLRIILIFLKFQTFYMLALYIFLYSYTLSKADALATVNFFRLLKNTIFNYPFP